MTDAWVFQAMFYHIHPLGLCGAPTFNDFTSSPTPRLAQLQDWVDHIVRLNLNAVYLCPVFESTEHGYNTADFFKVDRRLGDNSTLKTLIQAIKARGLRLIWDAAFTHVGRHFFAFQEIQKLGQSSRYLGWFERIDFSEKSPYGDSFGYEGWDGHYDLVQLNQNNPEVIAYLLEVVSRWVSEFDIDGLRLAGANAYSDGFKQALIAHCRQLKPDFALFGDVGTDDYNHWVFPNGLDSASDVVLHQAFVNSHAMRDYMGLASTLNQQFSASGMYTGKPLYLFLDNHDTNRIASVIQHPKYLELAYVVLFTLPTVPSVYYGSEWGIGGARIDEPPNPDSENVDTPLRPALDLAQAHTFPNQALPKLIAEVAQLRASLPALQQGDYQTLYATMEQFVFKRQLGESVVLVAVNASSQSVLVPVSAVTQQTTLVDFKTGERLEGETVLLMPFAWRVWRSK